MDCGVVQLGEQAASVIDEFIIGIAQVTPNSEGQTQVGADWSTTVKRRTTQRYCTCTLKHVCRVFTWAKHQIIAETLGQLQHIPLVRALVAERWAARMSGADRFAGTVGRP
jgi:hypothetical protein